MFVVVVTKDSGAECIYGRYADERIASKVQSMVGGIIMTTEEFALRYTSADCT